MNINPSPEEQDRRKLIELRLREITEALLAVSRAMEESETEYSGAIHLLAGLLSDLSRII